MRRIEFCSCLVGLLLAGMCGLQAQSKIPPPRFLTDEEAIRILLHRLAQGIRDQDSFLITDGCASEIAIDDSTTISKAQFEVKLKDAFVQAEDRRENPRFKELSPPKAGLTSTWDFGMEIDTVRILDEQTAVAETNIYFGVSEPDPKSDWPLGKKHREVIRFRKIGGEWRVKSVDKLIVFFESE
ncbi:hypothetical protein ES708_14876 [subsurface metagenome]